MTWPSSRRANVNKLAWYWLIGASSLLVLQPPIQSADFYVESRDEMLSVVSRLQAAHFLSHATFGPTPQEVDQLAADMRELGTVAAASAWIDRQVESDLTPPSSHLAKMEAYIADDLPFWTISGGGEPTPENTPQPHTYRQVAWWHNAISGRDQLRQRVAWALSQIFSVGSSIDRFDHTDFENYVAGGPTQKCKFLGLSNFYDVLVKEAFSRYRQVLGKVTYHSIMGNWLSYVGNQRAQGGIFPDENYAREVMQLFTIGLYLLGDNGVIQTNASGPIATYTTDHIREYAEVFTGLGYGFGTIAFDGNGVNPYSPYTAGNSNDPNSMVKFQVPMRMAAFQHDRSVKFLLNGLTLTNPFGLFGEHTEASANAEIDAALEGLVNHQSCPPFVVRRLIQRLVKSNPSKAYMNRVVAVFKNNGVGQRGDLKAVVKAILLDPEAWQSIRIRHLRSPVNRLVITTLGSEDCRLQEPIINYIRFIRFFKGRAEYQRSLSESFSNPVVISQDFRLSSRMREFEQSPYQAPSVFNFYQPDYQPLSEFTSYVPSSRIPNETLVAPEFQLVNPITSNRTGNFFRDCVVRGNRTEVHLARGSRFINFENVVTSVQQWTRTVVTYDFSTERGLADSEEGIDRMLERLDLYLCNGSMNHQYQSTLRSLLVNEFYQLSEDGLTEQEQLEMAQGAILSVVTSPCFLVAE